ncbi:unnamed protein product, partial [Arabidopsis halleri]
MAYGAEPEPSLIFLEIYVLARSVSNSLTNSASCNYNSCRGRQRRVPKPHRHPPPSTVTGDCILFVEVIRSK